MHRIAYILAQRVSTNPWLAMLTGLSVVNFGGLDLIETQRKAIAIPFTGELGLLLVGMQQVAFGFANLLLGTRLVGIGLLGARHGHNHPNINRMLKGYVDNPFLNFGLGFALLAMVSVQAWQDWVLGGIGERRSLWYFGLGLIALLGIARSAESVLLALGMMDAAESRGHFAVHLAHRINCYVRKPWLLIVVAITCIGFGVIEEVFVVATDPGTGVFIAHYGFLQFAVLEASKLLPIIFPGAVLAKEGLELPNLKDSS
jgi:hypothetical protein